MNITFTTTVQNEISSLFVDTTKEKFYLGFKNGDIQTGYYSSKYYTAFINQTDIRGYHYSDIH